MEYAFTYDVFGNVISTSAGGSILSTSSYAAGNGRLLRNTYGNGDYQEYTYDRAGNVTALSENGTKAHEWSYDASQLLRGYTDLKIGRSHAYGYDITGRLTDIRITDEETGEESFWAEYGYDSLNALKKEKISAGGKSMEAGYTYNKNGQPLTVTYGGEEQTSTYDSLGRLLSKSISTGEGLEYNYSYKSSGQNEEDSGIYQTTLLETEEMGDIRYRYTYDSMGNILTVHERAGEGEEALLSSYQYDALGQLVREDSTLLDQTIVYSYDSGGNLTEKKEYAYTAAEDLTGFTAEDTVSYGYDGNWKDKLTVLDGETITCDEMGNPLSYRGKTLAWEGRRQQGRCGIPVYG